MMRASVPLILEPDEDEGNETEEEKEDTDASGRDEDAWRQGRHVLGRRCPRGGQEGSRRRTRVSLESGKGQEALSRLRSLAGFWRDLAVARAGRRPRGSARRAAQPEEAPASEAEKSL